VIARPRLELSEIPASSVASYAGRAVGDYVEILKPRVMSLVVFTGFRWACLAPGHLHPVLAAVAVLCIAVGAGASGAINMWYDRDIDAVMLRGCGASARSYRQRRKSDGQRELMVAPT